MGEVARAPLLPMLQRFSKLGERLGLKRKGALSGAAEEDASCQVAVDRQKHFRRFLQEQKLWLGYDAYARVSMSLGVNQILGALSYYLIGKMSAVNAGATWI